MRGWIAEGSPRDRRRNLSPRTRVPSVVQLTEEFGIADATAHKVPRSLRESGLTCAEPGLGSFVAQNAPASTPPQRANDHPCSYSYCP
jgi:DNA-binding transcriptional regulator YhcF (GntR family)